MKACLPPRRSDLVVQSCYFFTESSPRDLAIGHGVRPCSFQNERKQLDFHPFGVGKQNKSGKWDEISRVVVSGVVNDTEKICKACGEFFAIFRVRKLEQIKDKRDNSGKSENLKILKNQK